MALGKRCSCCGCSMVVSWELYLPEGTWVTYVCRQHACNTSKGKCKHMVRIFEARRQPVPQAVR